MNAHKDWHHLTRSLSVAMNAVRRGEPAVAEGFSALASAATAPGALNRKIKELLALAIAVAMRCEGCIGFHVKASLKAGASREEILDVVGVAIYMGGGPSFAYGAQALEACDQFQS